MQPDAPDTRLGTVSPDGYWWWDGARWQPTAPMVPPAVTAPMAPVAAPRPFRSARLRAELATTFLLILVALNLLDIVNSAVDLAAYGGHLGAIAETTHLLWTAQRNALVAISWLLVAFPGSVVMVSLWVHRAYANLEPLGRRGSRSPALAVGWFFIPVANLWKPYQVVAELWSKTLGSVPHGLLGSWWACWLAGIVVGNLQMQVSLRETSDPASHTVPLLLSFASDAIWIGAALLLIRIVRAVTRAEDQATPAPPAAAPPAAYAPPAAFAATSPLRGED
jgi:uncharacterized protein DUF4328